MALSYVATRESGGRKKNGHQVLKLQPAIVAKEVLKDKTLIVMSFRWHSRALGERPFKKSFKERNQVRDAGVLLEAPRAQACPVGEGDSSEAT